MAATSIVLSIFGLEESGENLRLLVWKVVGPISDAAYAILVNSLSGRRGDGGYVEIEEIGLKQGLELLNIFKNYSSRTSLLDDFSFYENREKTHVKKSSKPATLRLEIKKDGDFPEYPKAGERKYEDESRTKKATNSIIHLTKNLSLNNGYVKKPTENSVHAVVAP